MNTQQTTHTYLLVHGAWHGAWCWRKVLPLLLPGSTVIAPDLPGHGQDRTPLAKVTFASYVKRITDLLDQASEPVILVGHSMGGAVISQAAKLRPEKIARLVYLTAFIPRDGQSLMQALNEEPDLAFSGMEFTDQAVRLLPEAARALFYHDCSNRDTRRAIQHLCPQALEPLNAPVHLTGRFASIPKAAITCTADRVISPALQGQMATAASCDPVLAIASGHSPFLCAPEQLATYLRTLAAYDAKWTNSQTRHVETALAIPAGVSRSS